MSFYSHAQIPRYKGQGKKKTSGQKSGAKVTCMRAEGKRSLGHSRPPALRASQWVLNRCWPRVRCSVPVSLSSGCNQNMIKPRGIKQKVI